MLKKVLNSVLCDFPFLSNALFCINSFYMSDTVHKQHIFFYLPEIALILADWETAPLYQSVLNYIVGV